MMFSLQSDLAAEEAACAKAHKEYKAAHVTRQRRQNRVSSSPKQNAK